jgi:solute carrier family 25 phosphate transporter 23/24/25/41
MPAGDYSSRLQAVLSFYDSVVNVTPEGDSLVSGETLEGLGTAGSTRTFFYSLFGTLFRLVNPSGHPRTSPAARSISRSPEATESTSDATATSTTAAAAVDEASQAADCANATTRPIADQAVALSVDDVDDDGTPHEDQDHSSNGAMPRKKFRLTSFVPDTGYFLAGAIAGGVSRTATAPLDRLKVYLLVNTSMRTETALEALKKGRPIVALQNAARPFTDAVKDLFRSGGARGFFAGNGLNVVKIMPETAIKFGSYEAAKRMLANLEGHSDPKKINSYSKFTAGGLAGMIAQ